MNLSEQQEGLQGWAAIIESQGVKWNIRKVDLDLLMEFSEAFTVGKIIYS